MSREMQMFEGCYDASRASALAGVPISTVYDWAKKGVLAPSVSRSKPKLWSYADLMALRIIYWLRHPKSADGHLVPATPMVDVRGVLEQLREVGAELWTLTDAGHTSPLVVDRTGRVFMDHAQSFEGTDRQRVLDADYINPLGPFDTEEDWGPDLRHPAPHLRIVPGKLSGEPHLARSRLTTQAVAALADRGFSVEAIQRLYPEEDVHGLDEAVKLEQRLAA